MACILLVEDNEMNRDMLSRRLTRHGIDMALAADGKQGLQMAETSSPEPLKKIDALLNDRILS